MVNWFSQLSLRLRLWWMEKKAQVILNRQEKLLKEVRELRLRLLSNSNGIKK